MSPFSGSCLSSSSSSESEHEREIGQRFYRNSTENVGWEKNGGARILTANLQIRRRPLWTRTAQVFMPTKCIILKDINGIYNCLIADDALRSYFENPATDNQLVLTIPVLSGFIIFKFSCLLTCVKQLRRACLNPSAGGCSFKAAAGVWCENKPSHFTETGIIFVFCVIDCSSASALESVCVCKGWAHPLYGRLTAEAAE